MFRIQYCPHNRVTSNPGSSEHILYTAQFDEHGHFELVESGVEDVYDMIQSHKDSTDIHQILRRFENGDVNALNKVQGVFADVTEMPKTYAEMLNHIIAGKNAFMDLPVETRAKFGHSFERWLAAMDDPVDFASKMGIDIKNDQPEDVITPAPAPEIARTEE